MIIVVRCISCGKVLADKWLYYQRECAKIDADLQKKGVDLENDKLRYFDRSYAERKELMERLGITRMCCKRIFLSSVDIIDDM